jgi:hypothetical protein
MTGFESKKAMAEDKLIDYKQELVDFLVEADFQYIQHGNGLELLNSYLEFGFTGYANMTLAELEAEVNERKQMENM